MPKKKSSRADDIVQDDKANEDELLKDEQNTVQEDNQDITLANETRISGYDLNEVLKRWPEILSIDFNEYFAKGFRPMDKPAFGKRYIGLHRRKGNVWRSLGEYTEERWRALNELFDDYVLSTVKDEPVKPKKKGKEDKKVKVEDEEEEEEEEEEEVKVTEKKISLLNVFLRPPEDLPKVLNVNPITLFYFLWAKEKGYEKGFSDFLNEVVFTYFNEKGVVPIMQVSEEWKVEGSYDR
jgi:hypothetical protein